MVKLKAAMEGQLDFFKKGCAPMCFRNLVCAIRPCTVRGLGSGMPVAVRQLIEGYIPVIVGLKRRPTMVL